MKRWSGRKRAKAPMWSPKRTGRSASRWTPSGRVVRAGKWIGWTVLGGLTIGVVGWGGMAAYRQAEPVLRDWLEIREITVTGLDHLSRNQVLERLSLEAGETQWSVKPLELSQRLLTHPWIKQADISRSLPHRLVVTVVERQPVAVLKSATTVLLLDGEGQVLSPLPVSAMPALPVLVGVDPDRLMQGEDRSRRMVQNGIQLAGLLSDEFNGLPEIDLANPDNAVAYVQGLRFQFGPASFEEKWERYRKVPALHVSATDEPGTPKHEIDLRYPGKVIVRERG